MESAERWQTLVELDEKLLVGGVVLSEWSTFIVRDSDTAFVSGAHLATILTAVAGIETHLRYESPGKKKRLVELIDEADIDEELKSNLHKLRRYRNQWVHISDPIDDEKLIDRPELAETELEEMAFHAVRWLRQVLYSNQWL